MVALTLLDGTYGIARLAPSADVPEWAWGPGLVSVTRTRDELSIVCSADRMPEDVTAERGWSALRVVGTLDFSLTGVLVSLTRPLAEAGISVFAISTYETDYLLVPGAHSLHAMEALALAGHDISNRDDESTG